ncbi:hypothetical protein QBC36DRAFT_16264 [Triangularia setosa]|uniref:Uncharacterized protein n=1 Tax=Triangularia setosa TaxID=2587417 RepID=A0AAN6W6D9_9PEZI|nr:hypothetical protein QBC36DRAFT_16264 [Podospora setosa]
MKLPLSQLFLALSRSEMTTLTWRNKGKIKQSIGVRANNNIHFITLAIPLFFLKALLYFSLTTALSSLLFSTVEFFFFGSGGEPWMGGQICVFIFYFIFFVMLFCCSSRFAQNWGMEGRRTGFNLAHGVRYLLPLE